MQQSNSQVEIFYAKDRREWRAWLEANYDHASGIWLMYYKKGSGKPRVAYNEAVEEALCFGWIDSRPNALDDERYVQLFSPRKPKSPWSRLNKQRVERLIEQGVMTAAGFVKIEAAKQDGSWSIYDAIENLQIPSDLDRALASDPIAYGYFNAFGNSTKKQILWWIESAKRAETRLKRIEKTVTSVAQNKNPLVQ
ncbi:MAG: hypothetical protein HC800_06300 [Phormidesmis sp. RL_2_1]|nr:hypothetical protein [Phormidesmis sp. RL_2_1]